MRVNTEYTNNKKSVRGENETFLSRTLVAFAVGVHFTNINEQFAFEIGQAHTTHFAQLKR
jgi:hypothetical protein